MFTENPLRGRSNAAIVVWLFLLMIGAVPVMQAQEPPDSPQDVQVRRKAELHKRAKGKVIAEGKNENAAEHVRVKRFTIEELQLDEPIETEIGGKKTEVYQAFRITVFGGPFEMRAMAPLLHIDDNPPLVGVESQKLDSVTFILYDRSLLREGATLTVGYGAANIELTDKLRLGEKRN